MRSYWGEVRCVLYVVGSGVTDVHAEDESVLVGCVGNTTTQVSETVQHLIISLL